MRHDDPIALPAQAGASHLHVFFGNTQTDALSTDESLRNAGNSTCRGGIANRSAYWVPALLDQAGEPLAPGAAQIYYKSGYGGIAAESIQALPSGLRMIAGDSRASSPQDASGWLCEGSTTGSSATIPRCAVGGRILMQVQFPQCWDGEHLDSDDHQSHVAYPKAGSCPTSHPVPIPAITFSIPYRVPASGSEGWRLDSDSYDPSEPGGYSAHGDWFGAWDPEIADTWLRRCINAGLDCHSHLLGDGRETYFDAISSKAAGE